MPIDKPTGNLLRGRHAVVYGGAGFLGSHLCDRLLSLGTQVTAVDNFCTGRMENLEDALGVRGFRLVAHEATEPLRLTGRVDYVLQLASPASPVDYQRLPLQTLEAGSYATHQSLRLARVKNSRLLVTSSSEVYGDPTVNPQPESYWGNVNPVGPRSVYDEAKRFAEALSTAYAREHHVSVGIARLFNVYGPRMREDDGRVVPSFICQALADEPLTVHGDGTQTRSLCYVDDMVDGLLRLLTRDVPGPVNLGNAHEVTVLELADVVQDVVGRHPGVRHVARPVDDPTVRCPDTAMAGRLLGWQPVTALEDGLTRTTAWFAGRHALAGRLAAEGR